MRSATEFWLCIAASLPICFPHALEGAPVRFALLTDPAALGDTIQFLRDAGCANQALSTFESLASNHSARLSINLSGFPVAKQGFYDFSNLAALLDAVGTNELYAGATLDFNCFDTVTLLAGNKLQTSLKPDDLSGPYLVWKYSTNSGPSHPWVVPAATPRDAFTQNYEGNWQKSVESFPKALRDAHICLTAALFKVHVLPQSSSTNCFATVLPTLQASWRRDGVRFPSDFEVLLLHRAEGLMLRTSHAGLVFPHGQNFTYIEKIGWSGYFVRLDVQDKADIIKWLGLVHLGTNISERLFVTLNESMSELAAAPQPEKGHAAKPTGNK